MTARSEHERGQMQALQLTRLVLAFQDRYWGVIKSAFDIEWTSYALHVPLSDFTSK